MASICFFRIGTGIKCLAVSSSMPRCLNLGSSLITVESYNVVLKKSLVTQGPSSKPSTKTHSSYFCVFDESELWKSLQASQGSPNRVGSDLDLAGQHLYLIYRSQFRKMEIFLDIFVPHQSFLYMTRPRQSWDSRDIWCPWPECSRPWWVCWTR